MASKHTSEKALSLLRYLPRVCLNNIRDNPGSKRVSGYWSDLKAVINCLVVLLALEAWPRTTWGRQTWTW